MLGTEKAPVEKAFLFHHYVRGIAETLESFHFGTRPTVGLPITTPSFSKQTGFLQQH
jgi:hypothetical protein